MCAQLFNSLVERISVERGNASGIGVGAGRTSENAGRDEQNPCPVTGLLPDLLFVIHVRHRRFQIILVIISSKNFMSLSSVLLTCMYLSNTGSGGSDC